MIELTTYFNFICVKINKCFFSFGPNNLMSCYLNVLKPIKLSGKAAVLNFSVCYDIMSSGYSSSGQR